MDELAKHAGKRGGCARILRCRTYDYRMGQRSSSPPPPPDPRLGQRVPIAMAVALEVVEELRARERPDARSRSLPKCSRLLGRLGLGVVLAERRVIVRGDSNARFRRGELRLELHDPMLVGELLFGVGEEDAVGPEA